MRPSDETPTAAQFLPSAPASSHRAASSMARVPVHDGGSLMADGMRAPVRAEWGDMLSPDREEVELRGVGIPTPSRSHLYQIADAPQEARASIARAAVEQDWPVWTNSAPEVEFLRWFHENCDVEGLRHDRLCWDGGVDCELVARIRFLESSGS